MDAKTHNGLKGDGDVFRRIADNAQDIIYHYRFKPKFTCVYVNPVVEKLLGYSPREFYADPHLWLRVLFPEDRSFMQARFLPADLSWPLELRLKRKDGGILWTEHYTECFLDESGGVVALGGMIHDITGRKRIQIELTDARTQLELRVNRRTAELLEINGKLKGEIEERQKIAVALSESERQKKALLDNILDLAWLKDANGSFIAVNEPFAKACGVTPESLVGKNDLDIWPWELAMSYRQDDREVMSSQQPKRVEEPILGPDGHVWWAETIRTPIFDAQGSVIGTVGIAHDVTERKQAEEVLRNGLSRLDQLVKARTTDLENANQELVAEIAVRNQRERELEAMVASVSALRTAATRIEMEEAVAEQIVDLLQVNMVALAMRNPVSHEVVFETVKGSYPDWFGQRQFDDVGISGYVINSGNSYFTQDLPNDQLILRRDLIGSLKAAACLPLKVQEYVIGVLWVASETRIDPSAQRFLLAVSDIVAGSLYRATLYEQTQQNAAQLTRVANIGGALAETLDLPQLYSLLATSVLSLLPETHTVIISMFDPAGQTVTCVYFIQDGSLQDTSRSPAVLIDAPGNELQADVLRQRRALIVNNFHDESRTARIADTGVLGPKTRSVLAAPLLAKGDLLGVLQLQSRVLNRFSQTDADLVSLVCNSAAAAVQNARLFGYLEISNQELVAAYDATIEGWSSALELRDRETAGHSQRVTDLTLRLAQAMRVPEEELVNIRRGSLLHDIGKLGTPDSIIFKTGPLNNDEREVMYRHPELALQLLGHIEYLKPAIDIPYCHHEHWNGTGYPRQLNGEEIPLAARIFTVVDVWDALLSDRSYRHAWRREDVLKFIKEKAGVFFDPKVVETFLQLI
jgi:PAS domain S-box-containing protein